MSVVYRQDLLYYYLFTQQDRVILGSDYPFPLGEHHPGKLIETSDLADELKVDFTVFVSK